ncbi:GatB/YqeY domain-containing protein [Parasutterella secunda]|uniref:GatB/YqeY domain-containing protein n=1 Tax=Parasutterella secunda TaxID=626947 RepID=A0ABS2GUM2_9BURK|nr:GatB/YqeY domain-containing protein [Parasutterella secunda]MBM6929084.1 GatB/YqeY domain-containing protein [Parasutterella secunda]
MTIKEQIMADMKAAMKAHDASRLGAIRLLMAAIKQKEVDERIQCGDAEIISIIAKLVKQRHDSIEQYTAANRQDLADKEQAEIDVLSTYLPKPLTEEEIQAIIDEAIATLGASGMAAMGKVMGAVKPKLTGRADMGKVSALIKQKLTA